MRNELVPKRLKEEVFWTIYFLLVRNKLGRPKLSRQASKTMTDEKTKMRQVEGIIAKNQEPTNIATATTSSSTTSVQSTIETTKAEQTLGPMYELLTTHKPFSSPDSKGSDVEQHFDSLFRRSILMNQQDNVIEPTLDNYYDSQVDDASQLITPTKAKRSVKIRLDFLDL
jgi:hypothetical protein